YMFRVVFIAFFGHGDAHSPETRHDQTAGHVHDAPAVMTIPLWILAVLAMVIGIGFAVAHPAENTEAPIWLTALAVTAAGAGIVLGWMTYQRRVVDPRALSNAFAWIRDAAVERFWLDELFLVIYSRIILGGSRIIGWIDRYVVDGIVNLLSALTLWLGDH